MAERPVIEAAGGLLWRPAERGVEIALVHRPKYDDWSVPKGKLLPGEDPVLGALREVREETGSAARLGRPLGRLRYPVSGAPKRVRYWAMERTGNEPFEPGDEVDALEWRPPRAALRRLQSGRDAAVLTWFLKDPRPSWPLILLRHGNAGERSSWSGEDAQRPLDALGHRQADALAAILAAYQVECAWSADVTRCEQSLQPYAGAQGLAVTEQPAISESGYRSASAEAERWLLDVAASGRPTVVCSQRRAIPGLVTALCGAMEHRTPRVSTIGKGGAWVFQLARGADWLPDIVSLERRPPPA